MAAPPAPSNRDVFSGVTLHNYNSELVKHIEELREKREVLNKSIAKEERLKTELQKKIHQLTEQLNRVNDSLSQKLQARNDYDITIQEIEAAYMKILESSHTLLHVLKRESATLQKKRGAAVDSEDPPVSLLEER